MSENTLETMENTLETTLENIRQLAILSADFQPQSQVLLNSKIQKLIGDLQKIDKFRSKIETIHIPLAVFDYIDEGRNPQLFTKDCIDKALYKNEETKGKIDVYRKFKNNLLLELQKEGFNSEINKYRAIRKDE